MSDTTLLAQAVEANPTDLTAALALADAVQEETGDEAAAAIIRRDVEKRAAYLAELASADPVARVKAMLRGYAREVADARRPWRTKDVVDAASSRLRSAICRLVGATNSRGNALSCVRFEVVAGDAAPTYAGESWHYETPGGRLVRHPNAYRRVAKSAELVYCPASHVVTVGADWVIAHAAELTA